MTHDDDDDCVKWKMTILFLTYRLKIVILYI